MDLAEWVAQGRYLGLLELIDMLPAASRMKEAIAQDEEAAEYILSLPEPEGGAEPWSPAVSEWTLTNQLLASVINELRSSRMSSQAVAGQKPRKEDPYPVPRTAVDRLMDQLEAEQVSDTLLAFGFDENGF